MKLKTRLLIAFLVCLLVPLLLGGLVFLGFSRYEARVIEKSYGIEGVNYNDLLGSVQFLSALNQKGYEGIRKDLKINPDLALDQEYLDRKNNNLKVQHSYLISRKGTRIIYNGWKDGKVTRENLPPYGFSNLSTDDGIYLGGEIQSILKQIDCRTRDGNKCSVFVVTMSGVMAAQAQDMLKDLIFAFLLIIVITASALVWWLHQSIVTPLSRLSAATQNIKEGNLDFTMKGLEADDEIGELYQDFEEMRKHLSDQAEERIRNDKENKELISNISHDLKTPITAVKGYVEGIMDGVADTPEKMNRYIRTIYNKTNEMDHLINELTFYSKIDSNRIPYSFRVLSANAYFTDCAEELELELEAKKFRLLYENRVNSDVKIIADPEQMNRVIHNIIGNSIKYNDKEIGMIRLEISDVGDFIQIDISDNGKGIAARDLPYIFDRFYRTDSSRSSSKGGSGIGLSIVRKIIEDHGGKIWAASTEGQGTTMSFVIRKYQEVPVSE